MPNADTIEEYKSIALKNGYSIERIDNNTGEVRISDGLHRISIYTTTGTISIYNYIDTPKYLKKLTQIQIINILQYPLTIYQ